MFSSLTRCSQPVFAREPLSLLRPPLDSKNWDRKLAWRLTVTAGGFHPPPSSLGGTWRLLSVTDRISSADKNESDPCKTPRNCCAPCIYNFTTSAYSTCHPRDVFRLIYTDASCNHIVYTAEKFCSVKGQYATLLSSSSLLYLQNFGQCVLRPSSGVSCRIQKPTQNFKSNTSFNPRGKFVLIPLTMTREKC